jgi:hypothetical protein
MEEVLQQVADLVEKDDGTLPVVKSEEPVKEEVKEELKPKEEINKEEVIEVKTRQKLTEGADVTANSMKPLAVAAAKRKEGSERGVSEDSSGSAALAEAS